jgi:hypothetical protein
LLIADQQASLKPQLSCQHSSAIFITHIHPQASACAGRQDIGGKLYKAPPG